MYAYVGCRTTRDRNARGDGINVYKLDQATGRLTHLQLVAGLTNPSFLAMSKDQQFLYCVHGDREEASAFAVNADGRLLLLNTVTTGGLNPVHLAIDPDNRYLLVSNHIGGSMAVIAIEADGTLGELLQCTTMEGPIGPHRVEQTIPKPHFNPFDPSGRFVIVPDKGLDRIFSFEFDAQTGTFKPAKVPLVVAREGSGPRHVAFHPSLARLYAINELDSTATTYDFDSETGELTPLQILSSLPESFVGNSRAAEIEVDKTGRFLYASNRGYDSVALFSIDQQSGLLTFVEAFPTEGKTPRFFALSPSGQFLYAANEDTDTIVTFSVDSQTGRLKSTGQVIETGSPVCMVFADRRDFSA
ncbi:MULTISPECIES: lactonase family protein [Pseudomonas]|uniref:lactonase family protein n=1 Tax=Pseudomonas TaxID=286 RepID=UPI0010135406|nr:MULTISPECIES: lactonase family protein [Pseudomonas]MBC8878031.1 lactonase family protein [Pseudomonas cerasi]RXT90635.1 hemagglutinin [Pseudomonas syringae]